MDVRRTMAVLGCAVLLAGCGSTGGGEGGEHAGHEMGEEAEFAFGAPGEATDVDRTIKISAVNGFRFQPSQLEVSVGETIEIEFANEDQEQPHEFVLGDAAFQEEHGAEAMDHGADEPYASPELTKGDKHSLVWTFSEPGEVQFACHVADHYERQMIGTITVTG